MKRLGPGIGALDITGLLYKYTFEGKVFSVKKWLTYAANETIDFVFDPTAYAPAAGDISLMFGFFPFFSAEAGPVTIDYYIDTDANDDGTIIPFFNRNGKSIIAAQSVFRQAPTVNADGNWFAGDLVPSSAAGSGITAPGTVEEEEIFIINHAYKILIRTTNRDGNDTQVGFKFTIVEK